MNLNPVRMLLLSGSFCLPCFLTVAVGAEPSSVGPATPAGAPADTVPQPVRDTIKQRQDLANAVAAGTQTAEAALAELKAQSAQAGDSDASLASAAADIGHRLRATGRATDASVFFAAAEESLSKMIDRTPDAEAALKAHYLANRAFLRALGLNKAALAKADLDAALKLAPNDPYLVSLRAALASDKAEQFRNTAGN